MPPVPIHHSLEAVFLSMGNHLSCIIEKKSDCEIFQIYILDFDSRKWSLYHEMGPFDLAALRMIL
jgi:hypothetical protein